MPDSPGLALETWGIPGLVRAFSRSVVLALNRLRKKVLEGARVVPSAAKAAPICNSLCTT